MGVPTGVKGEFKEGISDPNIVPADTFILPIKSNTLRFVNPATDKPTSARALYFTAIGTVYISTVSGNVVPRTVTQAMVDNGIPIVGLCNGVTTTGTIAASDIVVAI